MSFDNFTDRVDSMYLDEDKVRKLIYLSSFSINSVKFKCPGCNNFSMNLKSKQTRSADEGETILAECSKCLCTKIPDKLEYELTN